MKYLFIALVLFSGCDSQHTTKIDSRYISDPHFKGTVSLKKLETMSGYKLSVESKNGKSNLHIKDSIYRFQLADVNGDGNTDILLGITKKTHFEPVMERRLQIFRIESGKLRPLWLGSKVCLKLIDFKPVSVDGKCQIATLEQDREGFYCNGRYEWQEFGLRLIQYDTEKLVYSKAQQFFQHENKPS